MAQVLETQGSINWRTCPRTSSTVKWVSGKKERFNRGQLIDRPLRISLLNEGSQLFDSLRLESRAEGLAEFAQKVGVEVYVNRARSLFVVFFAPATGLEKGTSHEAIRRCCCRFSIRPS